MHRVRRSLVIASFALTLLVIEVPAAEAANPDSNWGWAKPLNQKQGLLYTTNLAFKQGNKSRSRSVWTPYRSRRSVQPNRSTVQTPFFRPGRTGLIPFNQVGRY
ncbi:hypothetical protein Pla100_54440 [Neorhodopirellula pilleata]|uniref:Uncharacterized protein n=1 Tax=Neorhodopirellula pilleata TaxID=2714738 RepID=A0A5C5ZR18_9BACT|nr:hypothetical protein Pla100_54440 [Neorhodopirellula pilleata]